MVQLYNKDSLQHGIATLEHWQQQAFRAFVQKMTDTERIFPCVPGQHGFVSGHLRYGFLGDPRQSDASQELAELLRAYTNCSRHTGKYASLIVFIHTPEELIQSCSVEDFRALYWLLLNRTSELDEKEWPEHIPTNPMDSSWEFCFHGESYFVYCATPAHIKRQSRYFPCLMLAITPRWVLQGVNDESKFGRQMKKMIRERLHHYDDAPVHPDLKWYGQSENYEWKQYFLSDDETTLSSCPFLRGLQAKKES